MIAKFAVFDICRAAGQKRGLTAAHRDIEKAEKAEKGRDEWWVVKGRKEPEVVCRVPSFNSLVGRDLGTA